MARRPIGERAMTSAERARRHRDKLRAAAPIDLFTKLIDENRELRRELRELRYGKHPVAVAEQAKVDAKAVDAYVAEFESLDETKAQRAAAAFKQAKEQR